MPVKEVFTPAEKFMSHSGVDIYHIYKNDDVDMGARDFWYATHDDGGDNDDHDPTGTGVFDVRELGNRVHPSMEARPYEERIAAVKAAIVAAIDAGEITAHPEPVTMIPERDAMPDLAGSYSAHRESSGVIVVSDGGDKIFTLPPGYPTAWIATAVSVFTYGQSDGKVSGRVELQHKFAKLMNLAVR